MPRSFDLGNHGGSGEEATIHEANSPLEDPPQTHANHKSRGVTLLHPLRGYVSPEAVLLSVPPPLPQHRPRLYSPPSVLPIDPVPVPRRSEEAEQPKSHRSNHSLLDEFNHICLYRLHEEKDGFEGASFHFERAYQRPTNCPSSAPGPISRSCVASRK